MSAPKRPPSHYDAVAGAEAPLDRAAGWLVDELASLATTFPGWIVDDLGIEVRVRLASHETEKRAVIGWSAAEKTGTITATPDASGWLLLVADLDGLEVFRGYMERPFEEYEIWPAGAAAPKGEDGPGRVSKRMFWASLNTTAWPALRALAQGGDWVTISMDESKLEHK